MVVSMTGFGRGSANGKYQKYTVEVKSVNNRYCEVRTNAPREMLKLDHDLNALVRKHFQRGKFDMMLKSEPLSRSQATELDTEAIVQKWKKLNQIRKKLNIETEVSLEAALVGHHTNGVVRDSNPDKFFLKAADSALIQLRKFREKEGKHLSKDIQKRVKNLGEKVAVVEKTVKDHRPVRMERMKERVKQLLDQQKMDESRLDTEFALLVEKADVTEEVVRLKGHLKALLQAMRASGGVGRKLDFLLQEVNREINTIGAKSADLDISDEVVEMKAEAEKVREQVQNLE